MRTIDRSGSAFAAKPLERHVFVGSDFECSVCHRPRALHLSDGFTPRPGFGTETLTWSPKARYGRHPYFYGTRKIRLTVGEQEQVDKFKS